MAPLNRRIVVGTVLAGVSGLLVGIGGCRSSGPTIICRMQNPATGEQVKMYKEIWYKVPAGYDEKKHIEEWQADQRKNGYTVELP